MLPVQCVFAGIFPQKEKDYKFDYAKKWIFLINMFINEMWLLVNIYKVLSNVQCYISLNSKICFEFMKQYFVDIQEKKCIL